MFFFFIAAPILPMRYTDAVYKNRSDYELCEAVNFLSVKIGSLDIEFPIHVYGTVIARDSLDKRCVYLFRCAREESQPINSKVCNSFLNFYLHTHAEVTD